MKRMWLAVMVVVLAVPVAAAASRIDDPDLPEQLRPLQEEDLVSEKDIERELRAFEAWLDDAVRRYHNRQAKVLAQKPTLNVRMAPERKPAPLLPDPDEVLAQDVVGDATTRAAWRAPKGW